MEACSPSSVEKCTGKSYEYHSNPTPARTHYTYIVLEELNPGSVYNRPNAEARLWSQFGGGVGQYTTVRPKYCKNHGFFSTDGVVSTTEPLSSFTLAVQPRHLRVNFTAKRPWFGHLRYLQIYARPKSTLKHVLSTRGFECMFVLCRSMTRETVSNENFPFGISRGVVFCAQPERVRYAQYMLIFSFYNVSALLFPGCLTWISHNPLLCCSATLRLGECILPADGIIRP